MTEISVHDKSFPPSAWGMPEEAFLASAPRLSAFQTPLLTLDASAMAHNVATMAAWTAERGLLLAPHGKTTMSPKLWRQLLDAGAWGITVATGWQAQVARSAGVPRILLANELIDPVALRWLGDELADPGLEVYCWADSVAAVEAMRAAFAGRPPARPVSVLVELGGLGGRAGARTVHEGLAVAQAIGAAPELELAGVAGWEGALGHGREQDELGRVAALLDEVVEFAGAVDWPRRPIVTAGGSSYFDVVAERFAQLAGSADLVLRSGAYQVHDAGRYSRISPLRASLRSAMHGWTRVLSTPEPGLVILDGGKRDFPYDDGLPTSDYGPVVRVNDQHSFLEPAPGDPVPAIGQVLRLGLGHPCTAFDKWRAIPVVLDADADDPVVVDVVRTLF